VLEICGSQALWNSGTIIEDSIAKVRARVGKDPVLLGLSGGVDSSVVAALLHKAIGKQLTCVFVDTGLLRLHEGDQVIETFAKHMGVKVIRVDAEARFLKRWPASATRKPKRKTMRPGLRGDLRGGGRKIDDASGWPRAPSIPT